ncbi:polysaccharide biosynthesis protein [mine drainage metagenome]|uniref:Polysaccharide biosynthesis protein n=2 Tax=mine drainage metagenome TaxID=410659 RepID=T0ZIZ0_9ZZZZ
MAGTFVLNLVQKVLTLAVSVMLARLMGPRNYGVYAAGIAVITLIGVPASLGLPTLLVREVSAYHVKQQWALLKGLLLRSNQSIIAVTLVLGVALLLMQPWFLRHEGIGLRFLWVAFCLLPLTLFGAMRMATLRGLHHIVLGQLPEALVAPAVLLLGIALWAVFEHKAPSPLIAISMRLAGVIVAFAIGAYLLWKRLPQPVRATKVQYNTRQWAIAAFPLMWVGAVSIASTQIDVVMLAALKGAADAGIYQVAARGAELVGFVYAISTMALQPTMANLYASNDLVRLRRVVKHASRIMFAASLVAASVFVLAGSTILSSVFGRAFNTGSTPLTILSLGWVLIAALGPARDALLMCGGEKTAAILMTIGTVLNVVLNVVLIPRLGTSGAAIATATSMVVSNYGYSVAVKRRLGYRVAVI